MDELMIILYESVPYQVYYRTVPSFILQKMTFCVFLNRVAWHFIPYLLQMIILCKFVARIG